MYAAQLRSKGWTSSVPNSLRVMVYLSTNTNWSIAYELVSALFQSVAVVNEFSGVSELLETSVRKLSHDVKINAPAQQIVANIFFIS